MRCSQSLGRSGESVGLPLFSFIHPSKIELHCAVAGETPTTKNGRVNGRESGQPTSSGQRGMGDRTNMSDRARSRDAAPKSVVQGETAAILLAEWTAGDCSLAGGEGGSKQCRPTFCQLARLDCINSSPRGRQNGLAPRFSKHADDPRAGLDHHEPPPVFPCLRVVSFRSSNSFSLLRQQSRHMS